MRRVNQLYSPSGRVGLSGPERVDCEPTMAFARSQTLLLPPRRLGSDPPGGRVNSTATNRSVGVCFLVALLLAVSFCSSTALAQYQPRKHSFRNARLPVGEIGQLVLREQPQLQGVMQPVLLRGPKGATVSVAEGAGFSGDIDAALVSMLVGQAYRLKVSNIPNHYGDVYPTVELIGRLHPPPGKETRYPIPIQLTEEELAMAMRGKYVTRVIYVEDPRRALAVRDVPDDQRYFEVMSHEDPYRVASRLGRPVAILRMGSVAPSSTGLTSEFLFNSPPIQRHALVPTTVPFTPRKLDPSELPTAPLKRDLLPNSPEQPDANEDAANIPEELPEKNASRDEPGAVAPPAADAGIEDADPFEDDPLDEATDADPFGELDGGGDLDGDLDGDLGDDLGGDLFDDI